MTGSKYGHFGRCYHADTCVHDPQCQFHATCAEDEPLTRTPEPDMQAAAERQLADLEAERARQAAQPPHIPRKAGTGYVRPGGRSSA